MKEESLLRACQKLKGEIQAVKHITVLTGAGISTESGIPDFRSPGGIWSKYRTVTIQEFLASHQARVEYWRYKKGTFKDFHDAKPNIGHDALVELEKTGKLQALITQNIDGLHQLAGNSSRKVIELHGTERFVICLNCGQQYDRATIQEKIEQIDKVPQCDQCNGWLKPATVSFGQVIPKGILDRAYRESETCELFLVIGSSLTVQPASILPMIAKQNGAWLGILNRDPTPFDSLADWICRHSAGEVLNKTFKLN